MKLERLGAMKSDTKIDTKKGRSFCDSMYAIAPGSGPSFLTMASTVNRLSTEVMRTLLRGDTNCLLCAIASFQVR
jgi:hypothetical protein